MTKADAIIELIRAVVADAEKPPDLLSVYDRHDLQRATAARVEKAKTDLQAAFDEQARMT